MKKMEKKQNELTVIMKAKDLCSYIMTVTQKSPKHFRYTFVSRLQNMTLDIIEHLYRANAVFIGKSVEVSLAKRLDYQTQALTELKMLSYFSMLAMEQGCILPKQYELISRQTFDCENLIGAWIKSDRRRFGLT